MAHRRPAMQEYYVRKNEETDARGPFTLEQLQSLAEAGQVDPDTYYYDANAEQWVLVSANAELSTQLFPEKRKLKLKPKEQIATLNAPAPGTPGAAKGPAAKEISVTDMLAAAEGKTAETRGRRDPVVAMQRAAQVGLYLSAALLLALAFAFIVLRSDAILSFEVQRLVREPLAWAAGVYLILGMLLVLGVAEAYPFVRLLVMLGLGYVGFVFWNDGESGAIVPLFLCTSGLFLLTLAARMVIVLLTAGLSAFGLLILLLHFQLA